MGFYLYEGAVEDRTYTDFDDIKELLNQLLDHCQLESLEFFYDRKSHGYNYDLCLHQERGQGSETVHIIFERVRLTNRTHDIIIKRVDSSR